jgi:hypothetical protein
LSSGNIKNGVSEDSKIIIEEDSQHLGHRVGAGANSIEESTRTQDKLAEDST